MAAFLGIEFLNANSSRRYPLAGGVTARDTSDTFEIPNDFLLGLYLPMPASAQGTSDRFFVGELSFFPTGVFIGIHLDLGSGSSELVATAVIPKNTHTEFDSYVVRGVDDYSDVVGKIVIGTFDGLDSQPVGKFTFAYASTRIEFDCIKMQLRGVASITVVNGADRSDKLTGHVELVAGANQRILVSSGDSSQIIVDSIAGEGTIETCDCEGLGADAATAQVAIKYINGLPPDLGGNYIIAGNRCITFETIEGGMEIVDGCATPCAGCDELVPFVEDLTQLKDALRTLQVMAENLDARQSTLENNLFGSMLSGQSCEEC